MVYTRTEMACHTSLRNRIQIPRIHIKNGWVWQPAYNPSTQKMKTGSLDKLKRLVKSASPVFSKKPYHVK